MVLITNEKKINYNNGNSESSAKEGNDELIEFCNKDD